MDSEAQPLGNEHPSANGIAYIRPAGYFISDRPSLSLSSFERPKVFPIKDLLTRSLSEDRKRSYSLCLLSKVLCILVLFSKTGSAQNLESIDEEKPVGFAGALTASVSAYEASGIQDRHTPFTWILEGSPTLSLYGVQIPFTIIVSEQQRDFRQPFNQFGLSPTYKSFTGHLGYRNLAYSRYTLNGHTFLGGGFDFKPSWFRLQGMYGRFQRAVEEDTSRFDIEPAYDRTGYAVKVGIGGHRDFFDLNMLYARDDSNSLRTVPLRYDIRPSENLVLGMNTRFDIIDELSLEAEGAASVFTRDTRAPKMSSNSIPREVHDIFVIRESTSLIVASQASVNLRLPTFQTRLLYERVEPDYRSLGTYYLLTDLERWTLTPTLLLLENKLRLAASAGFEHDNLLNNRQRTTNRFIGSGAISYNPSQRFGIDLNYSNYTTDQKRVMTRGDFLDTLPDGTPRLMNNVSQSISVAPRLMFQEMSDGQSSMSQIVSFVAAYQEYVDRTVGISGLANSKALTTSLNYNRAYLQEGRTIGGSIIFSTATAGIAETQVIGGSVNGSMSMLEEKALTLSASLGATSSSVSTLGSNTFSLTQTLNGSYKITDSNILNLSLYATENSGYTTSLGTDVDGYSEITTTLSFTHTFDF